MGALLGKNVKVQRERVLKENHFIEELQGGCTVFPLRMERWPARCSWWTPFFKARFSSAEYVLSIRVKVFWIIETKLFFLLKLYFLGFFLILSFLKNTFVLLENTFFFKNTFFCMSFKKKVFFRKESMLEKKVFFLRKDSIYCRFRAP